MRSLTPGFKAGLTYFALVFAAGFVLGSLRVLLLVPRLGERLAELIEMPFMLVVVIVAAQFVRRRFALPATLLAPLLCGCLALLLLLSGELLLVVALQGRTLAGYLASRDPVSGGVYLAMLALYALMPLLLARVPRPMAPPIDSPELGRSGAVQTLEPESR